MCSGFFLTEFILQKYGPKFIEVKVCLWYSICFTKKKIDITKISGILKFADSERAEIQTTWLTKSLSISVCFNSIEWHQRIIINIGTAYILKLILNHYHWSDFCEVNLQTRKQICVISWLINHSSLLVIIHRIIQSKRLWEQNLA